MKKITLDDLGVDTEQAVIQAWFYEEGDVLEEGDELVEIAADEAVITLQAPASGILAEVYFDEGENVTKRDVLCSIAEEDDEDLLDGDEEIEEDEEDEEEGEEK